MTSEELFSAIDKLKDEYVKFLADVVALESPTAYKAGVDACGKYFADKAREKGFKVETKHHEKSGDSVCITINENAPGKPVCFSGHIDTVHPVGFFGENPVRIENGIIYGPGVNDCKGGVVAGFMALDALCRCGFTKRPVKLILQTDEENSSATSNKATVRFMCEKAKDTICMLNMEPSGNFAKVTMERKGIAKYKFSVKGRALHASGCYKPEAASAIARAALMITELEKFKDEQGITANVGLINGGTAVNTVPAFCEFSVDFRYRNAEQLETIEKTVKDLCENRTVKGTTCTAERLSLRLCMPLCERNTGLLEKLNKIYAKTNLPTSEPCFSYGGSDAADFTAAGIPVVDQMGIKGVGAHTINEKAELDSLLVSAKRAAAAAAYLE